MQAVLEATMNRRQRILIIDDDESVRISLKLHFEDCGFEVFAVESAEEALKILGLEQVDSAIVDLRLPSMDGVEFIRHAAIVQPGMKCIIFTGSPAASIPKEILEMASVSEKLFFKPVMDLSVISDEVLRITG